MKLKAQVVSAAIACLVACSASAWNDTGHMTIAELTWRSLSFRERQKISTVLRQHPHYAELLCTNVPPGVETNEWVFLQASTWPDMVRPSTTGTPKPKHITDYHRGEWHYVNLPYITAADRQSIDGASHPPKATNILERLKAMEATLVSNKESASNRAVALCWYLHLMGDVHQPLHCVAWFSTLFPDGDSGGNQVAIRPQTAAVKLHSYWDNVLGTSSSYMYIAHKTQGILGDPLLAKAKLPELKAHQTYDSWAQESLSTAGAFVYLDGRLQFAKYHDGITAAEVPDLNPGYEDDARSIARRRIALAGLRLTQKLKRIY